MLELPDLTPEHFEILVMRELRKVGLEISELRIHRRTMLPEPDEGYLLEVKGVVRGAGWERRVLIACRRQQRPIVAAEVELLKDHVKEADAEGGLLFGAADFDPDALRTAEDAALALLRVTDGRTAFDTSGWGTPGHYPAWLPAYCAQSVTRDPLGQPRYELLESGKGGVVVERLRTLSKERRNA
jgi:Restriction endonuclease